MWACFLENQKTRLLTLEAQYLELLVDAGNLARAILKNGMRGVASCESTPSAVSQKTADASAAMHESLGDAPQQAATSRLTAGCSHQLEAYMSAKKS